MHALTRCCGSRYFSRSGPPVPRRHVTAEKQKWPYRPFKVINNVLIGFITIFCMKIMQKEDFIAPRNNTVILLRVKSILIRRRLWLAFRQNLHVLSELYKNFVRMSFLNEFFGIHRISSWLTIWKRVIGIYLNATLLNIATYRERRQRMYSQSPRISHARRMRGCQMKPIITYKEVIRGAGPGFG